MRSVIDFFKDLFNTHLEPARWQSGYWTPFHGWLNILSDLMIFLSFCSIPLMLYHYISQRKQVTKYPVFFLLFGISLLSCGFSHLLDAGLFWIPLYGLNTLIRFLTALFSLLTVIYLVKILPEVFQQKTRMEMEREIELRKLAELKLAETNKDLETFASMASHDLQEPLRKIKAYASKLNEVPAGLNPTENSELIQKIFRSAERMQFMVRDILSLSTLSADIIPVKVDTRAAIENALEDLDLKIKESSALITVSDLPPVMGSFNYVNQLFLNLIGNAIKFTQLKPIITITGEQRDMRVYLHVKDNGIGIEEKDRSRIFDAFTRLHTRAEFGGSGIGLAICRKIASILQGNIQVISKPGEGTTFTLELPAVEEKPRKDDINQQVH